MLAFVDAYLDCMFYLSLSSCMSKTMNSFFGGVETLRPFIYLISMYIDVSFILLLVFFNNSYILHMESIIYFYGSRKVGKSLALLFYSFHSNYMVDKMFIFLLALIAVCQEIFFAKLDRSIFLTSMFYKCDISHQF